MNKKITLFSLIILIIASIDNIRNLPAAALFGSSLIFFFIFAALVFLLPTALVSAELSSSMPDQGGVYHWVNRAFGKKAAMAAIWLQWINTMVWYPTMLSFVAGTFAYVIDPALAENKGYLICTILTVFWGLTWINLKGLHISAAINNVCAIIGTILPLLLLIALGILWVVTGQPMQIDFSLDQMIPSFSHTTSWVSLIAIMASFLGIELSGVHVNEIHNPQKNFPRALMVASMFIFFSMALGSLSIAFVLPEQEISLVSGVMQVFHSFFTVFHLEWMTPFLTLAIVIGSIGMMINWLISPAKGLLHAAEFGFLPPFFMKKNRAGVASNILIAQGIVVSGLSALFLFEPSINSFYWFLTALSTELYMVMYILMFAANIYLHYRLAYRPSSFRIPGGRVGMWVVSLLGLFGCITTIIVSFLPPDNINVGSSSRYLLMISLGNVITISPLLFFYRYISKSRSPQ